MRNLLLLTLERTSDAVLGANHGGCWSDDPHNGSLLLWRPLQSCSHRGRSGHPPVVHSRVFGQMVGPREPLFTHVATVRFNTRVRPTVSGQLVRPGKSPRTAWPHATVRFLSRMSAHVHLIDYELWLMCFEIIENRRTLTI